MDVPSEFWYSNTRQTIGNTATFSQFSSRTTAHTNIIFDKHINSFTGSRPILTNKTCGSLVSSKHKCKHKAQK